MVIDAYCRLKRKPEGIKVTSGDTFVQMSAVTFLQELSFCLWLCAAMWPLLWCSVCVLQHKWLTAGWESWSSGLQSYILPSRNLCLLLCINMILISHLFCSLYITSHPTCWILIVFQKELLHMGWKHCITYSILYTNLKNNHGPKTYLENVLVPSLSLTKNSPGAVRLLRRPGNETVNHT